MRRGTAFNKLLLYPWEVRKLLTETIVWYGTVAIIGAYALTSFGLLSPGSLWYQLLNATGAAGIVAISLSKRVYQPAVLNIIYRSSGHPQNLPRLTARFLNHSPANDFPNNPSASSEWLCISER